MTPTPDLGVIATRLSSLTSIRRTRSEDRDRRLVHGDAEVQRDRVRMEVRRLRDVVADLERALDI